MCALLAVCGSYGPGPTASSYFAYTGRRFIVLHGYRKQSQKAPAREIETAERRMRDFLDREG